MSVARLTEKHAEGNGYYMRCSGECRWDDGDSCTGCSELERIVNRLGEYEDTGLRPEEITALKEGCEKCDIAARDYEHMHQISDFVRAAELLKAEQEGRIKEICLPPEDACCGKCADFVRVPGTARGSCATQYQKRFASRHELRKVAQSTKACKAFRPEEGRSDGVRSNQMKKET